jgi:hypothetical protein
MVRDAVLTIDCARFGMDALKFFNLKLQGHSQQLPGT